MKIHRICLNHIKKEVCFSIMIDAYGPLLSKEIREPFIRDGHDR